MQSTKPPKEIVFKLGGGSLSFLSVLTLVFVVSKILGLLSWSWLWVFSPIWLIPVLVISVVALVCLIVIALAFIAVLTER